MRQNYLKNKEKKFFFRKWGG